MTPDELPRKEAATDQQCANGVALPHAATSARLLCFASVSAGRRSSPVEVTELCVAKTEEGALVVETREQGLRRARRLLRKYIPEGVNLSDELIAERRAEAARESEQRQ